MKQMFYNAYLVPIFAWNNFKLIILSTLDTIAPVKFVRIKQRTEEWVNSEVLDCIKDRDKAFYLFKREKS